MLRLTVYGLNFWEHFGKDSMTTHGENALSVAARWRDHLLSSLSSPTASLPCLDLRADAQRRGVGWEPAGAAGGD